jgi:hypothetical protein
MEGGVYIPDEVGAAVAKADAVIFSKLGKHIFYQFGHPLEIVANLQAMTTVTTQNQKYPLVALFTDILVDKNKDGFYGDARFTILIATLTKREYKAPERKEVNFKPLLQPIKTEVLKQLGRVRQFTTPGEIKYKEIEHYFWGSAGLYGSNKNIFNDLIDAIELRDIQVTVKPKICPTIKTTF